MTTAAKNPRNAGIPLDLEWVSQVEVNRSALERRAATHATRRSIKVRKRVKRREEFITVRLVVVEICSIGMAVSSDYVH
jgi:hypothetical protein